MGKNVFANNMEIAHKAGDGKVLAAFPDVCLSPPPPPAGPVPVPYPNTSFAKDLQDGSTTVKIGVKPLALKGQSFYQSSPLGNEAATRNFGGAVITHTISGKTYFAAHSMDVMVEGKNVCRHLDLTTSNHASYPGSTPPFPNAEMQAAATQAIADKKCACCNGPQHSDGADMHRDEWYEDNIQEESARRSQGIQKGIDANKQALANALKGGDADAITAAGFKLAKKEAELAEQNAWRDKKLREYKELSRKAVAAKSCGCPPVAPSPPCDVYHKQPSKGDERQKQHKSIDSKWRNYRKAQQQKASADRIPPLREMEEDDQVNHLTPKSAGGCPTGQGNLTLDKKLCPACKKLEAEFTDFQKLG